MPMTTQSPPVARRGRGGRLVVVSLLLLALGAGAGFAWFRRGADAGPNLATQVIAAGDIEQTVTALGSLKPMNYVDVGAQVSGQLQKVHVDVGDHVEKGQLLAEIDPTSYEATVLANRAELNSLRAQLAEAQAQLALAKIQNAHNETLYASDYVSKDTLDTTRTTVTVDQAKVAALNAQIEKAASTLSGAETNLSYTKIYAPMAGTVASQTALEGETLNANQITPVIVRVSDLATMTVEAQVSEADVVKIRKGMPAYFTILGLPERRWHGTVRRVEPTPETENDVVLFNVLIDVDNADGVLMTDMTTQVFFVVGEARAVPLLPLSALAASGANDQPVAGSTVNVRVLGQNGPEPRAVTLGLVDRTVAEVTSGLAVGETVVLSGGTKLAAQTGGGGKNAPPSGPPGMSGAQL